MAAAPEVEPRLVGEAMLRRPKISDPTITVGQAADLLSNPHVHAVLVVDGGRLLSVVETADLDGRAPLAPAASAGRLAERTTTAGADLDTARARMTGRGRRRLAVVGDGGVLLGLLCLKRRHDGFCSDDDVQERADERREDPGT